MPTASGQEFVPPRAHSPAYVTGGEVPRPTLLQPADSEAFPAAAQSLEALESQALASHPAIQAAEARVEAARGNCVQAGLGPNPLIGYSGQQLFSNGEAEQHGMLHQQTWVRGNKLQLNRAVAAGDIDLQLAQLELQQNQIRAGVRIAYYDLLAAQQLQTIAGELVNAAQDTLKTAEQLVAAGETDRSVVVKARIDLESVLGEAEQAQARVRAAWRTLAAATAQPESAPQPLAGDLESIDWDRDYESLLGELLSASPELRLRAVQVDKSERRLAREQVEPIADVTVQSIVQYDNSTAAPNAALQVTFPIAKANRNQGAIRAASAQIVASQRELEQLELELTQRLAAAWSEYETALAQARRYRDSIIPLVQENIQLIRQGISAGELSVLRLVDAQRELVYKQSAYLSALVKSWRMRALIECYLPPLDLNAAAAAADSWAPAPNDQNW